MSKSLGPKSYIALADEPEIIKKKISAMPTATGTEKMVIKELLKNTQEINVEFKDLATSFPPDKEIHSETDLMKIKKRLGESKYKTFMALFNFYMFMYIFSGAKDRRRFLKELQNGSIKFSNYKKLLVEKIAHYPEFVQFRKQRKTLIKNPKKIEQILKTGSQKARRRARKNLLYIKDKIGLA